MTDEAKASAAWQDVEQVLQQEPNLHVLKILIADAKAADAREIAALRAENEQLQQQLEETYVAALNRERTKCEAAEAQLTALQAELKIADDCYHVQGDELLRHIQIAERLQAEQAQWQREATKWLQRADHGFDPEEPEESVSYWQGVRRCAESILAALTAQQEKPVE